MKHRPPFPSDVRSESPEQDTLYPVIIVSEANDNNTHDNDDNEGSHRYHSNNNTSHYTDNTTRDVPSSPSPRRRHSRSTPPPPPPPLQPSSPATQAGEPHPSVLPSHNNRRAASHSLSEASQALFLRGINSEFHGRPRSPSPSPSPSPSSVPPSRSTRTPPPPPPPPVSPLPSPSPSPYQRNNNPHQHQQQQHQSYPPPPPPPSYRRHHSSSPILSTPSPPSPSPNSSSSLSSSSLSSSSSPSNKYHSTLYPPTYSSSYQKRRSASDLPSLSFSHPSPSPSPSSPSHSVSYPSLSSSSSSSSSSPSSINRLSVEEIRYSRRQRRRSFSQVMNRMKESVSLRGIQSGVGSMLGTIADTDRVSMPAGTRSTAEALRALVTDSDSSSAVDQLALLWGIRRHIEGSHVNRDGPSHNHPHTEEGPATDPWHRLWTLRPLPPIRPVSDKERHILIAFRHQLSVCIDAFPRFVLAVPWHPHRTQDPSCSEAESWSLHPDLHPSHAFEVLSAGTAAHPRARSLAARLLGRSTWYPAAGVMTVLGKEDAVLPWMHAVRDERASDVAKGRSAVVRGLLQLMERDDGSEEMELGMRLYWLSMVEKEAMIREEVKEEDPLTAFQDVLRTRIGMDPSSMTLSTSSHIMGDIQQQERFVTNMCRIVERLRGMKNTDRPERISELQRLLSQPDAIVEAGGHPWIEVFRQNGRNGVLHPMDSRIRIVGFDIDGCSIFKSSLQPLKLTLHHDHSPSARQEHGKPSCLIFKKGDDLRQDQLATMLITVMNRMLLRPHPSVTTSESDPHLPSPADIDSGLDLRITTYQVFGTGIDSGFIELVPDAQPISQVLADYRLRIGEWMRDHHYDGEASDTYYIDPGILDNYVRSCAGYCVITHILGVGDRHYDNLMITSDARLFHIDFGFLFGHDPKPRPPPMRLSYEVVMAMGGLHSPHFARFCHLCCKAFLLLRSRAHLLLNIIGVMLPGMQSAQARGMRRSLQHVHRRFRLHLSDEEAAGHLLDVIHATLRMVWPTVNEVIHFLAQKTRT